MHHENHMAAAAVEAAIASRRSLRAFRDTPVPRETVERLLEVAARAPSGTNMQPWRVHVLTGEAKARLSQAVLAAAREPVGSHAAHYRYYPDPFFEPYLARRRKVGWDLYSLLGIRKGDAARMREQHERNYVFFDAPVGLIFTIDARLEIGSWLDYGMYLQNIMIAARAYGLDTCPQAAFAPFDAVIRKILAADPHHVVVCGMALGYADEAAPENRLRTEREPVSVTATFAGF